MVIYTVTNGGLCCANALNILHFAKFLDTSMDKISDLYQPLLRLLTIPQYKTKNTATQKALAAARRWQDTAIKLLAPNRTIHLETAYPIESDSTGHFRKWHERIYIYVLCYSNKAVYRLYR